ncbi:hypothetical protein ACIXO6_15285 [Bacteroides fragilis]
MPYGFPSLSPLMDCHFYTSANGERACSRVRLMFFFLVSINGLIFLHFHRPIIQESVSGRMHAPTPAHKDLKGAVDKERNPAAFPRRYGQ